MSPIGKLFVVLNLVFSIAMLAVVANILAKGEEYKNTLTTTKAQVTKLESDLKVATDKYNESLKQNQKDLEKANDEVNSLKLDKTRLQDQLDQERRNNDQLRGDVTKIQASLGEFAKSIESNQSRTTQLTEENTKLRGEKDDAVNKQRQAEDDLARVQGELDQAKRDIADLEQKVTSAINKTADLENVINAAQKAYNIDLARWIGTPEPIDAVVQEVNDEIGFVVLSVGAQDNVKAGNKFDVYRGATYVGEVVVDETYPDNSTARITLRNAQFKKMDRATTKLGS